MKSKINEVLILVEKKDSGDRYHLKGAVEFHRLDLTKLTWGDRITDNDGKGRTVYVNQCIECARKFLMPTLVLVKHTCSTCASPHAYDNYWWRG